MTVEKSEVNHLRRLEAYGTESGGGMASVPTFDAEAAFAKKPPRTEKMHPLFSRGKAQHQRVRREKRRNSPSGAVFALKAETER